MWKKLRKKMESIYHSMACENPHKAVHATAAAAATIVAICPIGVDAVCLRAAECFMIISIFSHYGVKISTSVAKSIMMSSFAQLVGEGIALTALEAADAAIILNPAIGYAIKCGVACTLVETIGFTVIKSLDGGGSEAAKAFADAMCAVGLGADFKRVGAAVGKLGGITDKTEYAAQLDAKIAEAKEKSASWDKALEYVYDDPGCESSGAFENLMKGHWDKRLEKLVEAKKKL